MKQQAKVAFILLLRDKGEKHPNCGGWLRSVIFGTERWKSFLTQDKGQGRCIPGMDEGKMLKVFMPGPA